MENKTDKTEVDLLFKKHIDAITDNIEPKIHCGDMATYDGEDLAAKECASISIEFAKKFNRWVLENEWQLHPYKEGYGKLEFKNNREVENNLTEDELISEYIKTLKL